MLYKHTNSTLEMSVPPTHSPAIILSGVVASAVDDGEDNQELATAALRRRALPPPAGDTSQQPAAHSRLALLVTGEPSALASKARGAGTKFVDPADFQNRHAGNTGKTGRQAGRCDDGGETHTSCGGRRRKTRAHRNAAAAR